MLNIKALEQVGQEILNNLLDEYRTTLIQNKKVATRKTIESLRGDQDATENRIILKINANESLLFIISGRRKGAKLPVRKVSGRFELVPELREWKIAVGYRGADYILAKGISERGIEGIDITAMVIEKTRNKINELILKRFAAMVRDQAVDQIKTGFRAGR